MRVVIVDDDQALLKSLTILLTEEGHEVACYDDPRIALAELGGTVEPEILIVDYRMPPLDGTELLTRVRADLPAGCGVIMISGHTDQLSAEWLERFDLDGFLPKPIDLDQLLALIARRSRNGGEHNEAS